MRAIILSLPVALASQRLTSHNLRNLAAREDYIDTVCSPNTTTSSSSADSVVPPCIEVTTIQEACAPNGSTPIYYAAHAECICGGSFFDDWRGCQACLLYHGARSERDEAFYLSVVDVASSSLCGTATPTSDFAAIFSAVAATLAQPTTGATTSGDLAPSSTAVSLYYTLSGSQGPGAITGSAASATATTTASTGSGSSTGKTSTTKSSASGSGTASSGSAQSSSSSAGAENTRAAGEMLVGLAGLAVLAGL